MKSFGAKSMPAGGLSVCRPIGRCTAAPPTTALPVESHRLADLPTDRLTENRAAGRAFACPEWICCFFFADCALVRLWVVLRSRVWRPPRRVAPATIELQGRPPAMS